MEWPLWWKGVYLEAEKLTNSDGPKVGTRVRARAHEDDWRF